MNEKRRQARNLAMLLITAMTFLGFSASMCGNFGEGQRYGTSRPLPD